jgi:hypothetical protein
MGALSFSTEASVVVNGAEQDIEMSAAKRARFEAPCRTCTGVIRYV